MLRKFITTSFISQAKRIAAGPDGVARSRGQRNRGGVNGMALISKPIASRSISRGRMFGGSPPQRRL